LTGAGRAGAATTWGLATGFTGVAGLAAAAGLAGAAGFAWGGAGLAGAAFFTDRIAFPGAGLAGAGADALLPLPLDFSRLRICPASASLIELLWLLAAIDSFSAASSTSLFSRPRSLDSS